VRTASSGGDAIERAVAAAQAMSTTGVVVIATPGVVLPAAAASTDPRVRTVDLREAPAMRDAALRLVDGFSLSVAGHSRTADLVAPAVLDLIHSARKVS